MAERRVLYPAPTSPQGSRLELRFVFTRTHDGRPLRMLTLIDEFTRECLAIDVTRRLDSEDVLERLCEVDPQTRIAWYWYFPVPGRRVRRFSR